MKFWFRVPSIKKRISARISPKRYIRHNMWVKMPKWLGLISDPKKAIYNKIYNKTSFSVDNLFKSNTNIIDNKSSEENSKGCLTFIAIIALVIALIVNIWLFILWIIIIFVLVYTYKNSPSEKIKDRLKNIVNEFENGQFENVIELTNNKKELDNEQNNLVLKVRWISYYFMWEFEKTVNELTKLSEQDEYNDEVKYLIWSSFYELWKYDKAISSLQKITDQSENYNNSIYLLWESFFKTNKYDLAIESLKKAPLQKRKLDNTLIKIHYLLWVIYERKEDKKNMTKHYKKVYSSDIDYLDIKEKVEK